MCQGSPLPVRKLGKTFWPPWDISSHRPLTPGRSQMRLPSVRQLYKAEKVITARENARKPSARNMQLFRTRVSTLEDIVLCAVNVGRHSGTNPHLLCTRECILEKGFMCVVSLANLLGEPQPSICIEEFILDQGSTSAANVENPLTKTLSLFIPGEDTLEKIVTCAVSVCSFLAVDPS